MNKLNVGIDGKGFNTWGGGIDFIATIAEALESTGKVQTYLIAEEDSFFGKMAKNIKWFIISGLNIKKYKAKKELQFQGNNEMIQGFYNCSPKTIPVVFQKTENRFINNREVKLKKCLKNNHIDILLPSTLCKSINFSIPRIGYIYDFQHKYLPEFFTEEECKKRDYHFECQLANSNYLIVNALDVKKDIYKFYPNTKCEIIVLPFKPFQKPKMKSFPDLSKYKLPEKYYVVCNQFWMHKSHITVFEALEHIYNSGKQNIHIVCTGKFEDGRNPQFINELKQKINTFYCKNNIHYVGFVPKDDQIAIMKNSIGLIQPTLFEGGPGGGATYNALCLGITCILSNIPVNKEVIGYDNVFFFEKQNSKELANLMIEHSNDQPIDEVIVNKRIEKNKKEYGEILLAKLIEIVKREKTLASLKK